MPSAREIRRRIRSVRNTAQITKAMEMVSAAKMRRAQQMVLGSRPYAERMQGLIAALSHVVTGDEVAHPLLERRPTRNVGMILITADRGLAGSLNSNVIRMAASFALERRDVRVVTVGRKGRDWAARTARRITAEFSNIGDRPTILDTAPIARIAADAFTSGEVDEVHLIYNRFQSTTVQRPYRVQLLPIQPTGKVSEELLDFIFEPSPSEVLAAVLPRYVESLVYQALLEALASEHSARMIAMHNATENAKDIVTELTLSYNKARQAGITREILDITGGVEALRQATG